jgi:hypothetical protein
LPNEARVSGTFRMFNGCLQGKSLIKYMCAIKPAKLNTLQLDHFEWQFLSEINAVMQISNNIAMEL